MKIAAVIVLLLAAFWVWHHHSESARQVCVTAPALVCLDRPISTRRPKA